jgi:hypothetical protein
MRSFILPLLIVCVALGTSGCEEESKPPPDSSPADSSPVQSSKEYVPTPKTPEQVRLEEQLQLADANVAQCEYEEEQALRRSDGVQRNSTDARQGELDAAVAEDAYKRKQAATKAARKRRDALRERLRNLKQ